MAECFESSIKNEQLLNYYFNIQELEEGYQILLTLDLDNIEYQEEMYQQRLSHKQDSTVRNFQRWLYLTTSFLTVIRKWICTNINIVIAIRMAQIMKRPLLWKKY